MSTLSLYHPEVREERGGEDGGRGVGGKEGGEGKASLDPKPWSEGLSLRCGQALSPVSSAILSPPTGLETVVWDGDYCPFHEAWRSNHYPTRGTTCPIQFSARDNVSERASNVQDAWTVPSEVRLGVQEATCCQDTNIVLDFVANSDSCGQEPLCSAPLQASLAAVFVPPDDPSQIFLRNAQTPHRGGKWPHFASPDALFPFIFFFASLFFSRTRPSTSPTTPPFYGLFYFLFLLSVFVPGVFSQSLTLYPPVPPSTSLATLQSLSALGDPSTFPDDERSSTLDPHAADTSRYGLPVGLSGASGFVGWVNMTVGGRACASVRSVSGWEPEGSGNVGMVCEGVPEGESARIVGVVVWYESSGGVIEIAIAAHSVKYDSLPHPIVDEIVSLMGSDTSGGPTLEDEDNFGISLAWIGDLDGDGVASDFVVGAYFEDTGGSYRGSVYVVMLLADGTAHQTVQIAHETNGGPTLADLDQFGRSIAWIGDLDGDGIASDIVVGAVGDDTGGNGRGAVYVISLLADGTVYRTVHIADETNGGPTLEDGGQFGGSVAWIGDVDGDGMASDIVVGAFSNPSGGVGRGCVYVLSLLPDGSAHRAVQIASSVNGGPALANNDNFGVAVAWIGDMDGDGAELDVVVGANLDDTGGTDRGCVYVMSLQSAGTASSVVQIAHELNGGPSLTNGDNFGISIAWIGDVDGDGLGSDILVGARWDDTGGTDQGCVYVISLLANGNANLVVKIGDQTNGGPDLTSAVKFGSAVAWVRDIDGDGLATEIVVGAYKDDTGGADRGAVHVLRLADLTDVTTSATIEGAASPVSDFTSISPFMPLRPSLSFPHALASLDPRASDDSRRFLPLSVLTSTFNASHTLRILNASIDSRLCDSATIISSWPVSTNSRRVGVLCDGIPEGESGKVVGVDVCVEEVWSGLVYTISSSQVAMYDDLRDPMVADVVSSIASDMSGGPTLADGDNFGRSACWVGGDEPGAVLVGAHLDNTGFSAAGAVYLMRVDGDGVASEVTKIASGSNGGPSTLAASHYFGVGVAWLGDVDGDGEIWDVVVGAEEPTGSDTGSVYVMSVGLGVSATVLSRITDNTNGGPDLDVGDGFGTSVSCLGDVDGDGRAFDIAVGALLDDTGGTDRGAVYVFSILSDGSGDLLVTIAHGDGSSGPVLVDSDLFGISVSGLWGWDGWEEEDGRMLAIGAFLDDTGETDAGALHLIHVGSDGSVSVEGKVASGTSGGPMLDASDSFAFSVMAIGDLDGDGVTVEVMVGAFTDDTGGTDRGAVYVLSLDTTTWDVTWWRRVASEVGGGPTLVDGNSFGSSVALLGDLSGLGRPHSVMIGAIGDDTGGTDRGAMHVLSLSDLTSAPSTPSILASHALPSKSSLSTSTPSVQPAILASLPRLDPRASDDSRRVLPLSVLTSTFNASHTLRILNASIDSRLCDSATIISSWPVSTNSRRVGVLCDGIPEGESGKVVGVDVCVEEVWSGLVYTISSSHAAMYDDLWLNPVTSSSKEVVESGMADSSGFGSSIAWVGDLDGDGLYSEFVIGARSIDSVFVVAVHKSSEWTVLQTIASPLFSGTEFGASIAWTGVKEVAVGAPEGNLGDGLVAMVSLFANGSEKSSCTLGHDISLSGDNFGSSLAFIERDNGDEVLVVGAPGTSTVFFLLRDQSDTCLATSSGTVVAEGNSNPSDLFGMSVGRVGSKVLLVGLPGASSGLGQVAVVSISDLSSPQTKLEEGGGSGTVSLESNAEFGSAVAWIGDANYDSVQDVVVGAPGMNSIMVFELVTGDVWSLTHLSTISHHDLTGPSLSTGDLFGSSICPGLLDPYATGSLNTLLVGVVGDDEVSTDVGAVHILALGDTADSSVSPRVIGVAPPIVNNLTANSSTLLSPLLPTFAIPPHDTERVLPITIFSTHNSLFSQATILNVTVGENACQSVRWATNQWGRGEDSRRAGVICEGLPDEAGTSGYYSISVALEVNGESKILTSPRDHVEILEPSPTPTPSVSPTPTLTPTQSPSPTTTPTSSPTISPTPTPTVSSNPTSTPTPTTTPSPSSSSTSSPIPTTTPSPSSSSTSTPSPTQTPSTTPFSSSTSTPSPTQTPSQTPSPTPSSTPSAVASFTPTPSPTNAAPVLFPGVSFSSLLPSISDISLAPKTPFRNYFDALYLSLEAMSDDGVVELEDEDVFAALGASDEAIVHFQTRGLEDISLSAAPGQSLSLASISTLKWTGEGKSEVVKVSTTSSSSTSGGGSGSISLVIHGPSVPQPGFPSLRSIINVLSAVTVTVDAQEGGGRRRSRGLLESGVLVMEADVPPGGRGGELHRARFRVEVSLPLLTPTQLPPVLVFASVISSAEETVSGRYTVALKRSYGSGQFGYGGVGFVEEAEDEHMALMGSGWGEGKVFRDARVLLPPKGVDEVLDGAHVDQILIHLLASDRNVTVSCGGVDGVEIGVGMVRKMFAEPSTPFPFPSSASLSTTTQYLASNATFGLRVEKMVGSGESAEALVRGIVVEMGGFGNGGKPPTVALEVRVRLVGSEIWSSPLVLEVRGRHYAAPPFIQSDKSSATISPSLVSSWLYTPRLAPSYLNFSAPFVSSATSRYVLIDAFANLTAMTPIYRFSAQLDSPPDGVLPVISPSSAYASVSSEEWLTLGGVVGGVAGAGVNPILPPTTRMSVLLNFTDTLGIVFSYDPSTRTLLCKPKRLTNLIPVSFAQDFLRSLMYVTGKDNEDGGTTLRLIRVTAWTSESSSTTSTFPVVLLPSPLRPTTRFSAAAVSRTSISLFDAGTAIPSAIVSPGDIIFQNDLADLSRVLIWAVDSWDPLEDTLMTSFASSAYTGPLPPEANGSQALVALELTGPQSPAVFASCIASVFYSNIFALDGDPLTVPSAFTRVLQVTACRDALGQEVCSDAEEVSIAVRVPSWLHDESALAALPAPAPPLRIPFENSGRGLVIRFSGPTDRAKKAGSFGCGALLQVSLASLVVAFGQGAQCIWRDDSTLGVQLGWGSKIVPGNSILVKGGLIRARSALDAAPTMDASGWIRIVAPSTLTPPKVLLSGPEDIGVCDTEILLDASGSAGGGGRKLQFDWSLQAFAGVYNETRLTSLQSFLVSSTNFALIRIPASFLDVGAQYWIDVRVTTFLGATASFSSLSGVGHLFRVSSAPLPKVILSGGRQQRLTRAQPLAVTAIGTLPNCGAAQGVVLPPNIELSYAWSAGMGVYRVANTASTGELVLEHRVAPSASRDARILFLPAGRLRAAYTYSFHIVVQVKEPGNLVPISTATVGLNVIVQRGALVATFVGGSRGVSASGDGSVLVDVSQSRDPDAYITSSSFPPFPPSIVFTKTYEWECAVVEKGSGGVEVGDDCGSLLQTTSPATRSLKRSDLRASYLGSKIEVSVSVSSVQTLHSSSGSSILLANKQAFVAAVLDIQSLPTPAVGIARVGYAGSEVVMLPDRSLATKVSASRSVPIRAVVLSDDGEDLDVTEWSFRWEQIDGDLPTISSTSSLLSTAALNTIDAVGPAIEIKSGILSPGSSYRLRVSATESTGKFGVGSTTLSLLVNQPPSSGELTVEPTSGVALETEFRLSAEGWLDDVGDDPFEYAFFVDAEGGTGAETEEEVRKLASPLRERTRLSQRIATLPAATTGNVTVYVVIADRFGASSVAEARVEVFQPLTEEERRNGTAVADYVAQQQNGGSIQAALASFDGPSAMVTVKGLVTYLNDVDEADERNVGLRSDVVVTIAAAVSISVVDDMTTSLAAKTFTAALEKTEEVSASSKRLALDSVLELVTTRAAIAQQAASASFAANSTAAEVVSTRESGDSSSASSFTSESAMPVSVGGDVLSTCVMVIRVDSSNANHTNSGQSLGLSVQSSVNAVLKQVFSAIMADTVPGSQPIFLSRTDAGCDASLSLASQRIGGRELASGTLALGVGSPNSSCNANGTASVSLPAALLSTIPSLKVSSGAVDSRVVEWGTSPHPDPARNAAFSDLSTDTSLTILNSTGTQPVHTLQIDIAIPLSASVIDIQDLSDPIQFFMPTRDSTLIAPLIASLVAPDAAKSGGAGSVMTVATASCIFWDTSVREYRSNGCHVENVSAAGIWCACDHLTDFRGRFENLAVENEAIIVQVKEPITKKDLHQNPGVFILMGSLVLLTFLLFLCVSRADAVQHRRFAQALMKDSEVQFVRQLTELEGHEFHLEGIGRLGALGRSSRGEKDDKEREDGGVLQKRRPKKEEEDEDEAVQEQCVSQVLGAMWRWNPAISKERENTISSTSEALLRRVGSALTSAFRGVAAESAAHIARKKELRELARLRARALDSSTNLCARTWNLRSLLCELWWMRILFSHSYFSVITKFDQGRDRRMRLIVMLGAIFGAMFVSNFMNAAVNPDNTSYRPITFQETFVFALVSSGMQLPIRLFFEWITRFAGRRHFRIRYFPLWREVEIRKAVEKRIFTRISSLRNQFLAKPELADQILSEDGLTDRFQALFDDLADDTATDTDEEDGLESTVLATGTVHMQVTSPSSGREQATTADVVKEEDKGRDKEEGDGGGEERNDEDMRDEDVDPGPPLLEAMLAPEVEEEAERVEEEAGRDEESNNNNNNNNLLELGNKLVEGERVECIACKSRVSVDMSQCCQGRSRAKRLLIDSYNPDDPMGGFSEVDMVLSGWSAPPSGCVRWCGCFVRCCNRHPDQKYLYLRTWRASHGRPFGACWFGSTTDSLEGGEEDEDGHADEEVDTTGDGGFVTGGGGEGGIGSLAGAVVETVIGYLQCSCRLHTPAVDTREHFRVSREMHSDEESAQSLRRQIEQLLDDKELRRVERSTLLKAPRGRITEYLPIFAVYFFFTIFFAAVVLHTVLFGLYHGDEVTLAAQASFWISQAMSLFLIQPLIHFLVTYYAVVIAPVLTHWCGWCPCRRRSSQANGLLSGRIESVSFVQAAGSASGLDPERAVLAYGVTAAIASAISFFSQPGAEEDDDDDEEGDDAGTGIGEEESLVTRASLTARQKAAEVLRAQGVEVPDSMLSLPPGDSDPEIGARQRKARKLIGRRALQARLLREFVFRRYRNVVVQLRKEGGDEAIAELREIMTATQHQTAQNSEPGQGGAQIRSELLPESVRDTLRIFESVARVRHDQSRWDELQQAVSSHKLSQEKEEGGESEGAGVAALPAHGDEEEEDEDITLEKPIVADMSDEELLNDSEDDEEGDEERRGTKEHGHFPSWHAP